MRVLALNGSPRLKNSNTDRVLQPFLRGAREAGAETETVYVGSLNIKPCKGCFGCWVKTPGACVQKDDMAVMLEKLVAADVIVYAAPLYVLGFPGHFKNLIDRTIPLAEPWLVQAEGSDITSHPSRHGKSGKAFLISVAGFPERKHFEPLVLMMERWCELANRELLGKILVPASETLRRPEMQALFQWYFDAAREAGLELVRDGRVSDETQAVLDRKLFEVPPGQFREMANAWWRMQMKQSQAE